MKTKPNAALRLPTTRATTAYGYLTAIAKLALEEPKRINMGVVVLRGSGLEQFIAETSHAFNKQVNRAALPACNTVGCVAGWGLTLAGRTNENTINRGSMAEATKLFGLSDLQADELFMPDHLLHHANKQTRKHATAVVAHIKKFQQKYKLQLQATKIERAKP